jgi:DNA-binding transcriptional MerR regulator/effector-binding domain-containing protein
VTTNSETYLSIGDFSRATHLTIKTLRHYHQLGLLEPVHVDAHSGYRRYAAEQIPVAQVIRRFRDLDMPLEEIRDMLGAPDLATRNKRITRHLERLEEELGRTRRTVSALRALLDARDTADGIVLRAVPAVAAASIGGIVDIDDPLGAAWFQGALAEIYATLEVQGVEPAGCAGGVYADDLFTRHRGECTLFVPCDTPVRPVGRVEPVTVPAGEFAVIEHPGSTFDIDRSYGALAAHVTGHSLAVQGPMREYYVVGRQDTPDASRWRTEVCWPVFDPGSPLRD